MVQPPIRAIMTTSRVRCLLYTGLAISLLFKIWLATRLELYSDEIFYWLASTRPALAYSDLPFMTALLVGIGNTLADHSPLAVRSLFLALGTTIPLLVVWVARPVVGERRSLEAGLLTLCFPLLLFIGLLAVPDVPIVALGLLTIGFAERAIRLDQPIHWLALGVAVALGMSTHYRFILFPFTLFLFLLLSRQHRYLWRTGRLWLAGLIASLGLYPSLAFNLRHDLSGLDYHLVSRHPWSFQSEGLLHVPTQLVIVTPLLYGLLLLSLVLLWRQARKGDSRSLLFALFATVPLGLYALLAPWADTTRTTLHWPLSGYLPLLVFSPVALRAVYGWFQQRVSGRAAKSCLLAIPLTGLAGGGLTMAGIGSQGFNTELQQWIDTDRLSNKMAGWKPLARKLEDVLKSGEEPQLIVTDNYYTAAQIDFYLNSNRELTIHTIDLDKAVRDGRLAQLQLWNMHEPALLAANAGKPALFITEDSTLNVDEKRNLVNRACTLFAGLEYREQWHLLDGLKPVSLYGGEVRSAPSLNATSETTCPLPSYAWLDAPQPTSNHHGTMTVAGWAYNDGNGVQSLTVLLDGEPAATLSRDVARPDVVEITDAKNDPQAPLVGFRQDVPLENRPPGTAILELQVISRNGERQLFGRRMVRIGHAP
ncbi:MAG: glycosyltransferase family 39 protein [Pseudohongiellaceae bacterium]